MKHLERLPRELPLEVRGDDGESKGLDVADTRTPAHWAEIRERRECVRSAVLSLPAEFRETVVLCELEELSYEEAARILDCPLGTVRSRLHRGRALLLAKLEMLREPPKRANAAR
jgi:RNA polymerase sigma-70 factor (ECF subfamily)